MPSCSVVVCKNTSSKVNYVKDGISFHVYPKDPKIKEKWINTTGRGPDWFPTKNSTICSSHFEPKCFQPLKKVRRLFEWSVPTLNLRTKLTNFIDPLMTEMSVDCEFDENPQIKLDSQKTCEQPDSLDQHSKDPDDSIINETPRKKKMRLIISVQKSYIKKQKSQIRRLQKSVSRYRNKIATLENMVENFKEKKYISGDENK